MLFAFEPRRTPILLLGGDKSPDDATSASWNRWCDTFVPVADDLYDAHLHEVSEKDVQDSGGMAPSQG